jgi:hypothetical protein
MPPSADDLRVTRNASLTLINAMIFQQVLAAGDVHVPALARTIEDENPSEALVRAWKLILTRIDYLPIFTLAAEILEELRGTPGLEDALRALAEKALRITSRRTALRHDLMGRIYHRLLADAKYFGAFYTTVPAATLLLKLTLDNWDGIDWAKIEDIEQLRIADLACGTGTLLKSVLQAVTDNHVRARAARSESPDLQSVHRVLVERCLFGLDVIPYAIHLAASALAMHSPDVHFKQMNLYTLPLHGKPPKLGSLEFLTGREKLVQADLFGSPTAPGRRADEGGAHEKIKLPALDLCVMNPPFTRSVGGNLLFGNAPERERRKMQAELKKIVSKRGVPANITAGLAPVFVALAHQLLKWGGRLALVLPRALISGVAWRETRLLLGHNYHVEYVVVSHEPGRWNFSENTKLSECLVVAKWIPNDETAGPTIFVNLWENPRTSIEALTVANAIKRTKGVKLHPDKGTSELRIDSKKIGEQILSPSSRIRKTLWKEEAAFSQTELCRAAYYLAEGKLFIPGRGRAGRIDLVALQSLGELGPDVRDIHDSFRTTTTHTPYAAFWGHATEFVERIAQNANRFLTPLPHAKKGRHLRDPHLMWSRAGRLLITERLRLNTAKLVSIRVDRDVLSNTWWPFRVRRPDDAPAEDIECALAVWLNSSLGILLLIANRVETEGAWVKLKKPILEALPVLNALGLGAKQRRTLLRAFENLSNADLSPLPDIERDMVRKQIDDATMTALGIDADLAPLRELLAAEPLLSGTAETLYTSTTK